MYSYFHIWFIKVVRIRVMLVWYCCLGSDVARWPLVGVHIIYISVYILWWLINVHLKKKLFSLSNRTTRTILIGTQHHPLLQWNLHMSCIQWSRPSGFQSVFNQRTLYVLMNYFSNVALYFGLIQRLQWLQN